MYICICTLNEMKPVRLPPNLRPGLNFYGVIFNLLRATTTSVFPAAIPGFYAYKQPTGKPLFFIPYLAFTECI